MNLEITGCKFYKHVARSILVRTRNVKIQNCTFERTHLAAIHVSCEPSWKESDSVKNVIIRNNKFKNCGMT